MSKAFDLLSSVLGQDKAKQSLKQGYISAPYPPHEDMEMRFSLNRHEVDIYARHKMVSTYAWEHCGGPCIQPRYDRKSPYFQPDGAGWTKRRKMLIEAALARYVLWLANPNEFNRIAG